jgi:hypothetical protein
MIFKVVAPKGCGLMKDGRLMKFTAIAENRAEEDLLTEIAIMAYQKVKVVKFEDPSLEKKAEPIPVATEHVQ